MCVCVSVCECVSFSLCVCVRVCACVQVWYVAIGISECQLVVVCIV